MGQSGRNSFFGTLCAVTIGAFALVLGASGAQAQETKLTFAVSGADRGPLKETTTFFADRVKELTDGRVTVQRFTGGSLGGELQLNELLMAGEVDFIMSGIFADNNFPELSVASVPFILTSWEDKKEFYDNPVVRRKIEEALEALGLEFLQPVNMGQQYFTANKALLKPEDIEGVKLRVAEDRAQIEMYKAVGALATPLSSKEIFGALQTGLVDAQVNTLGNNYGRQLWEVQSHMIRSHHVLWPWHLAANSASLDQLSDEDRKAVEQAALEMRDMSAKAVEKFEGPMLETIRDEHGMEIVEWDTETVQEWTQAAKSGVIKLLDEKDPEIAKIVKEMAGL